MNRVQRRHLEIRGRLAHENPNLAHRCDRMLLWKGRSAERNADGVDVSLVRWFLTLTPSERLDVLQNYLNSLEEFWRGMIDFRRILETLCRHEVEFVVVGGVAAVLNGAAYMTFDVDVVHRRSSNNVLRLLAALHELNARYRNRPELVPDETHLTSHGHQLLLSTYGPLDVLGAIEGGLTYDALLPSTRSVSIAPECTCSCTYDPGVDRV